jgi:hypothetical protein
MSEGQSDPFRWATAEDAWLAYQDSLLFGNLVAKRGEDGLLRRVDPFSVSHARRATPLTRSRPGGEGERQ